MSRFNGNAVGLKTDSAYELSWDKMKEITAGKLHNFSFSWNIMHFTKS